MKIVKYISLCNYTSTTRAATTYATPANITFFPTILLALFTGASFYFEVVMKISSTSGTAYAKLVEYSGSTVADITGAELTTKSSSVVRLRTGALTITNARNIAVQIKSSSTSYTTTLYSARLIIVQEGIIERTATFIELGNSAYSTATTSEIEIPNSGYFYLDKSKYPGLSDARIVFSHNSLTNVGQITINIYAGNEELGSNLVISKYSTVTTVKGVATATIDLANLQDFSTYSAKILTDGTTSVITNVGILLIQTGLFDLTEVIVPIDTATRTTTSTSFVASNVNWLNDILDNLDDAQIIDTKYSSTMKISNGAGTASNTLMQIDGASEMETLTTKSTSKQFNESPPSFIVYNELHDTRIKSSSSSYTTSTYGSYITQTLALRRIRHPVHEFGGLV